MHPLFSKRKILIIIFSKRDVSFVTLLIVPHELNNLTDTELYLVAQLMWVFQLWVIIVILIDQDQVNDFRTLC